MSTDSDSGQSKRDSKLASANPDPVADIFTSMLTLAAKYQVEAIRLCGNRLMAYQKIPTRLCGCRTPADVRQAQLDFFKAMQQHYLDATRDFARAGSDDWNAVLSGQGEDRFPVEPESAEIPEDQDVHMEPVGKRAA